MRLANLKSGQLDFIERVAPSDMAGLEGDSASRLRRSRDRLPGHHDQRRQERPRAEESRSARMRACARRSSSRSTATASCRSRWTARRRPATSGSRPSNPLLREERADAEARRGPAKALLKEAGVTNPSFTLMTPTTSDAQRIAQVVQAMAKEAGFDVKIQSDRVRDLAQPGRQGRVRGLRARLERPRRSGRQPLQLPRLQAAAELRRLLQARGGRAAQPVARRNAIRRSARSSSSRSPPTC